MNKEKLNGAYFTNTYLPQCQMCPEILEIPRDLEVPKTKMKTLPKQDKYDLACMVRPTHKPNIKLKVFEFSFIQKRQVVPSIRNK